MKNVLRYFATGGVIMLVALMFSQCGTTPEEYVWIPKTGSYVDDSRAIDTLMMNWSDSTYIFISNEIEWDYNHGKIKDKHQVFSLYQKLLDESSYCSFAKVDSILKLSSVDENELAKYRHMNKFLFDDYKAKGKVDSSIRNDAKLVNQSQELIDAYDKVKRQCGWGFTQAVSTTLPYVRYDRVSAAEHENSIKSNKFWKSHFHNNTSFNNSFPKFPQRREDAKHKYYTETVKDFSQNVLKENSPYSLQENVQFYVSLVRNIKTDLGTGSAQADDATKAIVAYFKDACANDISLSTDEKIGLGNYLCSQIDALVGKKKDQGLASFVLTL